MTDRDTQGHRHVDHTGDVAVELWAPTETALLSEANRAVIELLTGRGELPAAGETDEVRHVELETIDREDRLVQWLNEIIYLAVSEGLLVRDADIEIRDEPGRGDLVARCRVAPLLPGELVTELKSATYHDLRIEPRDEGGLRAQVVIDV